MGGLEVTQSESLGPPREDAIEHPGTPPTGDLASPSTRPSGGAIAIALAIVAGIAFVIPLLITRHYGALGIVRNDDWSYLRTLFRWVDDGKLDFNNWVSMTLIGQLVLAAPLVALFGHNITLLQFETAFLGFAGLVVVMWCGFAVTRRLWVGTFVASLVAAGPLWGALSFSFMTDIPAFALSMLTCALGIKAIMRPRVSMPFLVASVAAGFAAFTIRQYALVPVVAIAIVGGYMLIREGDRARVRAFGIALGSMTVFAAIFWLFWHGVPHSKPFTPAVPSGHSIRALAYKGTGLLRLVGLLVSPALVLAGPLRIMRRSWSVANDGTAFAGVGVAAALAYTAQSSPSIAFAGNYIAPDGILAQGVAFGHRPDIFPPGVFDALIVIGTLSASILAIALVPFLHGLVVRVRDRDWELGDPLTAFLGLVIAGYAIAYALAAVTNIPLYDRYTLPVVPLVAILLLRRPVSRRTRRSRSRLSRNLVVARAIVTLVLLALLGVVYTADSSSFDGSRWHVAEAATRAGWDPKQIRGGFEWVNYSAGTHVSGTNQYCVTVALNPPQGIHDPHVVAYDYYRSPFEDPIPVVALRTTLPCTPAHKPASAG